MRDDSTDDAAPGLADVATSGPERAGRSDAAPLGRGTLTTADLRAFTDDQIRQRVLSDVISVGARATHDEMSTARFADGYQDDPAEARHLRLLTDRISRAFTVAGQR
jgi:hypothetical protein